jgi:type IV pilus assembly protein PilE
MHRSGILRARYHTSRWTRGFSLIELMVAVAIVSILLAIAVPSYSAYVKKSRRGEAEATLVDIAQREQQYFLDQRAYAATVATVGATVPPDLNAFYTFQICQTTVPCTAPGGVPPTYAVIATPVAGSAQAGDPVLTIDSTGAKTPTTVW